VAIFLHNLFVESELWKTKLEAGGFEPPSRDASRQASTCVVASLFFFALPSAMRPAPGLAISESSCRAGPNNQFSQPAILRPCPTRRRGQAGRAARLGSQAQLIVVA